MEGLLVSYTGAVVTLTLDRPERRNALTPELIEALIGELELVDADPDVRVVVLTGTPPAFCAGFDIERIESQGGANAGAERDLADRLSSRVAAVRVPVIAKLNGVASGAGCDLALGCDLRFASSEARLSMPPARLGVLYGWQGMARLVRTIGPARAKELLFSGELVNAERAFDIGLVDRVVAPHRLDDEVDAFVGAVVANAPLSVAASKLIVNLLAEGTPSPETLAQIDDASARVWASEDAQEGPRAFRERRRPDFRGR